MKLRDFETTKFTSIEEVKDLTKTFLAGEFFSFVQQCLPEGIRAELGNNFLKLLENPAAAQAIVPQVMLEFELILYSSDRIAQGGRARKGLGFEDIHEESISSSVDEGLVLGSGGTVVS